MNSGCDAASVDTGCMTPTFAPEALTALRPARIRVVLRHLLAALTVTVCLLAGAGGAVTAAAAPPPCSQQFGSFSAGKPPPACWRPYGSGSPLNKAIPPGAQVAADSRTILHHMLHFGYRFEADRGNYIFQTPGRTPVYWSRASDPVVTVHCTGYWGPNTCQGANGISIDGLQIHLPSGAQPEHQWDGHMIVVDQAAGTEYDFERASWTGSSDLTVWSGSEIPISGRTATGLGGEATAANLGLLGGIVRAGELRAGVINHALAVSVPCTTGYVWPATGPWGEPCRKIGQSDPSLRSSAPQMGTLLQLHMTDREIAAIGAPPWQQAIMTAMAHYGMYVNDTNGGSDNSTLELEKEGDESFTSFGMAPRMANLVHQLGGVYYPSGTGQWVVGGVPIDVSRLRVIDPCVAQGGCAGSSPAWVLSSHRRSLRSGPGHAKDQARKRARRHSTRKHRRHPGRA